MNTTSTDTMLRTLGYATTSVGITAFQRDYNRLGTRTLRVSGELDKPTREALVLAHASAQVFTAVRDQGSL